MTFKLGHSACNYQLSTVISSEHITIVPSFVSFHRDRNDRTLNQPDNKDQYR